jgi:hypothetical protein
VVVADPRRRYHSTATVGVDRSVQSLSSLVATSGAAREVHWLVMAQSREST